MASIHPRCWRSNIPSLVTYSRRSCLLWTLLCTIYFSSHWHYFRQGPLSLTLPWALASSRNIQSIKMIKHSWDAPLTSENHLEEWIMKGSAVPTSTNVIVTAPVTNKIGLLFNKSQILTNRWTLDMTFCVNCSAVPESVTGVSDKVVRDGTGDPRAGFALWYVQDDPSLDPDIPESMWKHSTFGFKTNPVGLGVIFKYFDGTGNLQPSVSVVYSEDPNTHSQNTGSPWAPEYYFDFISNRAVTFSLMVDIDLGVSGKIRYADTDWSTAAECFNIQNLVPVQRGFVGLTGFTGLNMDQDESPEGTFRSYGLHFTDFNMTNLDLEVLAEGFSGAKPTDDNEDIHRLLHSHSSMKDPHEVAEALRAIITLQLKNSQEFTQKTYEMTRSLEFLHTAVETQTAHLRDLYIAMNSLNKPGEDESGKSVSGEALTSFKVELSNIKQMLHKHSVTHQNTLHSLTQRMSEHHDTHSEKHNGPEIQMLSEKASKLEQIMKSSSSTFSYMTFAMITLILVCALLMWKKFRDMEKKHYL